MTESCTTLGMDLVQVLLQAQDTAVRMRVKRLNSVLLFMALLQQEESPLYDAIFSQIPCDLFTSMLQECKDKIEEIKIASKDQYSLITSVKTRCKNSFHKIIRKESKDLPNDAKGSHILINLGTPVTIQIDDEVSEILGTAEVLVKQISATKIDSLRITQAMVVLMPVDVLEILKSFGVRTSLLKETLLSEVLGKEINSVIDNPIVIPENLRAFVTNLNQKFKGLPCDISGRDKECALVWQTLQKQTKRNVILIGEPGVGKTSIVEKITFDIINGNCPEEFKDFTVISLDVNASVAGTKFRGEAEERYSQLIAFLEVTPKVILFIDEVHLIRGAGSAEGSNTDLANALKPILAGKNIRVIGATTSEEYQRIFSKDGAIKRRFRPVTVREPLFKDVYPMLKKSIDSLSRQHGVSIDRDMVDFIILNSACFNYETKNPDRTKDLIDLSMVVAKQNKKTKVDRESVLANFEYNFELFENEDLETRRRIAYHEAGHCVLQKCSKHLEDTHVIAVSIMPTDDYAGVTVGETNYTKLVCGNMEYFIDVIATNLAGRVSEVMHNCSPNSGAAADLRAATNVARSVVADFGMCSFGQDRAYTEDLSSPKAVDRINEEIDVIIKKAYQRAEEVLTQHSEEFNKLVEALIEKGIVGEDEINEIFKDTVLS